MRLSASPQSQPAPLRQVPPSSRARGRLPWERLSLGCCATDALQKGRCRHSPMCRSSTGPEVGSGAF